MHIKCMTCVRLWSIFSDVMLHTFSQEKKKEWKSALNKKKAIPANLQIGFCAFFRLYSLALFGNNVGCKNLYVYFHD